MALDLSRPYSGPNGDGGKAEKHTTCGNVDDSYGLPMAGTEVPWMHWPILEFKGSLFIPIFEVYSARKRGNKKKVKDHDYSGSKDLKYSLHVFYEPDQQSKAVATSALTHSRVQRLRRFHERRCGKHAGINGGSGGAPRCCPSMTSNPGTVVARPST